MSCCRCRAPLVETERVFVGVPFADSGAGGPACYAHLRCARILAMWALAPDWLADEIAMAKARVSGHGPP